MFASRSARRGEDEASMIFSPVSDISMVRRSRVNEFCVRALLTESGHSI
jgi:hypothetical protein